MTALAPLLALGLCGAAYSALVIAGLPPRTGPLALPLGLALAAALWRPLSRALARADRPRDPFGVRLQIALWALLGAGALLFALYFGQASLRWPQGDWDAWMNWNSRARFLYRGGWADAGSPYLVCGDYPMLVPGLVALGFSIAGGERFAVPVLIACAFAALTAALLGAATARLRGRSAGAMAAGLLLATPAFLRYSVDQYADAPLGALVLAAAACAVLALDRDAPLLGFAGLFASLGAHCKNEGLLYLCALLAGVAIASGLRGARSFAIGAAPLLLLLAAFKLQTPSHNDFVQAAAAAPPQLLAKLTDPARWRLIAAHAATTALNLRDWALMALAAPLALVASLRAQPRLRSVRALSAMLALSGAGEWLVYLATPHDLPQHLGSSADRLLIQLWPTALLLVAVALLEDPERPALPSRRLAPGGLVSPEGPR